MINGTLPEGYVAIKEEDARLYQKNIKAYRKLLQDHLYLKDMFERLQIQYNELLQRLNNHEATPAIDVEKKNMRLQLEQLTRQQKENQKTIENLRKSMLYCRDQVYHFRERAGRKMDRRIKLNGVNSALDNNGKP